MEIRIRIRDVDYGSLLAACTPLLRGKQSVGESAAARLLSGLAAMPPARLRAALDALPQQTKDEAAVALICANSGNIAEAMMRLAHQNGVAVVIEDVRAEK